MPVSQKIISSLICFIVVLAMFGCKHINKPPIKIPVKKAAKGKKDEYKEIKYTGGQLEVFLDSVGKLPVEPLMNKAGFFADSVFRTLTKPVKRVISASDFKSLKKAIRNGGISVPEAKQIFGQVRADVSCNAEGLIDSVPKGTLRLRYFPFSQDKNQFYEYAVRVGDPEHCSGSELYFFKRDSIIARQDGYSRFFDDDVKYFKNTDGETIVYRLYEFDHGSGIWWLNYFFYKYDDNQLIPVLNELQNGNEQEFWGLCILWLESTVQATSPLKIKMVYNQQFYSQNDTAGFNYGTEFTRDSAIVKYTWDAKSKTLRGQYEQSKLSRAQILSYYLGDNEYLFINANYKKLKSGLKSKSQRTWILNYLNGVKNYYNRVDSSRTKK